MSYKFDFNKEAQNTLEQYGFALSNTLLVHFKANAGREGLSVLCDDDSRKKTVEDVEVRKFLAHRIEKVRKRRAPEAAHHAASGMRSVVFSDDMDLSDIGDGQDPDKIRSFLFDHETLGHCATAGGLTDIDIGCEMKADSSATLHHIKRFKEDGAELAEHIAWFRAMEMLTHNNADHMTAQVIDHIIYNISPQALSATNPKDMLERADNLAADHRPPSLGVEKALSTYTFLKGNTSPTSLMRNDMELLHKTASTALQSPDWFSFYIGARFFQPFLKPEGVTIQDINIKLDEDTRQNYADRIMSAAYKFKLNDLFIQTQINVRDISERPALKAQVLAARNNPQPNTA
ncbi:MAG: hypothetical protein OXT65_00725 [Alphaproteobacteria bacterium]|nr:hypothetical protein [Alphaproteobacteria bacterium]